jgi:hypothetical protein
MLFAPEKIPLLSRLREQTFPVIFFGFALVAMAGWVYWLSSIVLKMVLWFF